MASPLEVFTVMRLAVLDSDGVDPLAEPGAFDVVRRVEAGELELLSTDVLAEEHPGA